ncbi:hypothetical protein DTO271D3_6884 [Paecilomyces variotii]|nr:hypothetical protein DTO271D3_6884 [Paecilomyces variotii]KAJ9404486.1 hypothetical protein DTO045G8_7708 [Paecilomyces variotii]
MSNRFFPVSFPFNVLLTKVFCVLFSASGTTKPLPCFRQTILVSDLRTVSLGGVRIPEGGKLPALTGVRPSDGIEVDELDALRGRWSHGSVVIGEGTRGGERRQPEACHFLRSTLRIDRS